MSPTSSEHAATLVLAIVALVCYLVMALLRVRGGRGGRRLLFLDSLLAVGALEIVADTLGHDFQEWRWVATATQGALMAGGIALLLTYRHREED